MRARSDRRGEGAGTSRRAGQRLLAAAAVAILGPLTAPVVVRGQVIEGHVLDEATRSPLSDVRVAALDSAGQEHASAGTDSVGGFELPVARGRYSLRLERIGYQTLTTEPLQVGRRETVTLELRLGATAIPLEPLVVMARVRAAIGSAAFYRRMATYEPLGAGRFYTRAWIDSVSSANVHMLLARDPAVRIVRGRFHDVVIFDTRGTRCLPALFINGVLIRNNADTDLSTWFHPDDIEGIEIYPSNAFTPGELNVMGCGSLAIWTRSPGLGNPFTLRRLLTAGGVAAGLLLLLRL
ncbi:MAG TPA: carboxypeptidase-like regulatory domain-containing protein [Longimicrobiales bacterium]|nr:carboxypeptidase-like regulatory domain-containing protein [Longimicrobiales bacterium]